MVEWDRDGGGHLAVAFRFLHEDEVLRCVELVGSRCDPLLRCRCLHVIMSAVIHSKTSMQCYYLTVAAHRLIFIAFLKVGLYRRADVTTVIYVLSYEGHPVSIFRRPSGVGLRSAPLDSPFREHL